VFKLSRTFLAEFVGRQPDWGPVGYVTYKRTYARDKDDGSTEEFWETIARVVEGVYSVQQLHCKTYRLPWLPQKAQRSAQEMYRRMWEMKFLPPGRGLWAMGTNIIDRIGGAALMNCAFTSTKDLSTDFSGPFCFLMDMLMLGSGVGFDTLGAGSVVVRSPKVNYNGYHYVEDTREGWVELLRRHLDAYVGVGAIPIQVDYSGIRPKGVPIKTFGGTAAGPEPLKTLVKGACEILDALAGEKITSTAIVDLMNIIGKCVVAGNVRRSSELAIGDIEDEDFLQLKDKGLHEKELYNHRWASNNSISAKVGMDYSAAAKLTALNGEPGYVWLDNARKYGRYGENGHRGDPRVMGFNPCVEQPLEDREMCCLVETFPSRHDSLEDYTRTLKFAYLYGKTVTLIPTHDERTNAVIMRNRRIGTSQSGIIQSFNKIGRREHFRWSDLGYQYIRSLDETYSDWLCVPRSIKVTTVKPSGTVSLLPGVTPGIHYPHSQFYYRTIRFQDSSPLLSRLEEAGYRIEKDKYSPNTVVVYFPIKEKWFDRSKDDVSMFEQLENVAQMQQHWSDNGVSATVTFTSAEARDIASALELYESRLKAISFLPLQDHGYEQAPYQKIDEDEYERAAQGIKEINWSGSNTHEQADSFCDGEVCLIAR
jgi:ribonucleoside-triphosphate reductase (thioredoxin)